MSKAPSQYLDLPTFQKQWSALPPTRVDPSFWSGMMAFCEVFLKDSSPFASKEFFSLPRTGRPLTKEEVHYIDANAVDACNDMRARFDRFTLWNPCALSSLLKIPINAVVEQLLLAVEFGWMDVEFIVSCRSCAHDIRHFSSASQIAFSGTYHTPNIFICPMCTDRTEITSLDDVHVFFILTKLAPIYCRRHHRLYSTEVAKRHILESFFCPSGASFCFTALLPQGNYLLTAPFAGVLVNLNVEVGCSAFDSRDPYLPCIVDLKKYVVASKSSRGKSATVSGTPISRTIGAGRRSVVSRRTILQSPSINGELLSTRPSLVHVSDYPPQQPDQIESIKCINIKQGKVQFRIFNESDSSGFIDLCAAFDTRAEFSALQYPTQMTISEFMHRVPRGLRSPQMKLCLPQPPSTTRTKGVFVVYSFDMRAAEYDDPQLISVLREVHRYSLEDHDGLLLGVSHGGSSFECSFLTVTSALASSLCFFQRVLVRLGESIAMCLRCSITEGPLSMATYQGQYNDADNTRSAYPDVQFVGPAVGVSTTPQVLPPVLRSYEEEACRQSEAEKRTTLNFKLYDEEDEQRRLEEYIKSMQQNTMIRFEMRSVALDGTGTPDTSLGAQPLRESYHLEQDPVLPYFLTYLCEQLQGSSVVKEARTSVLLVPLSVMHVSVQLPTLLDRSTYTKELTEPF